MNEKKIFDVDVFINKLYEICNIKTAYVFGSAGEPVTNELIDRKAKEQPSWYTAERIKNLKALSGKGYYGFDCSNLLKALFWGWTGEKLTNGKYFNYQSNTVQDKNADGIIGLCQNVSDDMSNLEIGEAMWFKGHIGIYVGVVNGVKSVIDCTPSLNKVCVNAISRQKWLKHGKLPWIDYDVVPMPSITKKSNKFEIMWLQQKLNRVIDKKLIKDSKLVVDGVYGEKTSTAYRNYARYKGWQEPDGWNVGKNGVPSLSKF